MKYSNIDTPRQFATELMKMAEEYSNLGNELAKIQIEKSSAILMLKAQCKTFKEAELLWQATESGKKEIEIVYKLRGIKELMSANKTKIRVMNEENRNQY